MVQDSQTQATQPQMSLSGFNGEQESGFIETLRRISDKPQDIEAIDYELIDPSKIALDFDNLERDENGSLTEEAFIEAKKILNIQKQVLDLLGTRGQVKGRKKRHEGDAGAAQFELDKKRDAPLEPHTIKELHGRIEESLAKSDNCRHKITFYEQNIHLFLMALSA
jgi:hypothetical protein